MNFYHKLFAHVFLIIFIAIFLLPVYLAIVAASHNGAAMMHAPLPIWPGSELLHNVTTVWQKGVVATGGEPVRQLLVNSFIMAILIAVGKIVLALCSAFALVYFDFPGKKIVFLSIFVTLMLPIEVRIVPTFQIVASLGWLNQFSGLTLPLMASATATFLFRQFFKTIPSELVEASKLDGAGPLRFFWDIVLPLSKVPMASLFIILFIYGWNQYLWPLLVTIDNKMATVVMGIRYLADVADQVPQWHLIMTMALLAMLPPCIMVFVFQRWFEQGVVK